MGSPPARYGLNWIVSLLYGSSPWTVARVEDESGPVLGIKFHSEVRLGRPQPDLARSCAGSFPMNHSKAVQAASGCLVELVITAPAAVIQGFERLPYQVKSGYILTLPAATACWNSGPGSEMTKPWN